MADLSRATSSGSIVASASGFGKRLLGRMQLRQAERAETRTRAGTCDFFCNVAEDSDVPAVGGIEVENSHLDVHPLLPPYVALFEPKEEDIWLAPKMRAIFLNQPLQPWEQDALSRFKSLVLSDLGLPQDAPVPRWLRPHMTRVLQQSKYKPEDAVKIYRVLYRERVKFLPIRYADVKDDLATGVAYWHGRDVRARPLMVISMARALPFLEKPHALQRLFLFHMEFAVRHLLVPGRVECWSVLIDCSGVEKLPLWKSKDMAQVLGSVLGKVYSGRMTWLRIFNFPTSMMARALRTCVESVVAALGKSDKVSFVKDADKKTWFSGLVAPGQLEQRFGGSAPDVPASDVYPYRMFATPEGYTGNSAEGAHTVSLHSLADVGFREGMLWSDTLNAASEPSWREAAAALPLPKVAAEYVGAVPCTDVDAWMSLMEKRLNSRNGAIKESSDKVTTTTDAQSRTSSLISL